MKQGVFLKRAIASVIAALAAGQFSTQTAQAQVLAIGPDGQMGYISTPAPISPDCVPPQIWTLTNGHYSCQNPPPQGNHSPPGGQPVDEGLACLTAFNTWTGYNNYFSHAILNNPGNLGGPLTGPYSGNGLDQYNAQVQAYFGADGNIYEGLVMVSGSQPTSQNDMFEVGDYFCWVQPQTVNVIGLGQGSYCSPNGGSANCGGGGYGN